mgnify:CR=1 FL=1
MSNLVRFEKVDNELNILRIGGKSFLPPDVEWPTNPNGEKMVFIFNIPTNFLNSTLQFNYPKDQVISVFTTYNREDYFLDSIVYNGDIEELQNIKNGYTKVILHSVASPRNDADFLISAREIVIDKETLQCKELLLKEEDNISYFQHAGKIYHTIESYEKNKNTKYII